MPATEEIVTLFKADLTDLEAGVAKATATLRKYEDFSEGAAASGNNLSSSLGSLAAKTATLGAVQQKVIQQSQQAGAVSVKAFNEAGAAADREAKRVENLTQKVNELRAAQGQKVSQPSTSGTASTAPRPVTTAAAPAQAQPTAIGVVDEGALGQMQQEALALLETLQGITAEERNILTGAVAIVAEYEQIRLTGEQFPGQFEALKGKAVELVSTMSGITREEAKAALEADRTEDAFAGVNKQVAETPKKIISLQAQIRKAKAEAAAAVAQFGQFDPRAIEAVKGVARLEEEFNDLNASIQAFNPEQKFRVVAQLGQNIAGGLTAAQGALTALGVGGEDAAEALAKVQGLLAVTQGLDAFAGIGDSLKNFIALLRSSTVVQTAATAVTERDVAAKGVQTGAIAATATATNTANVATKAWTTSLLANPFVLAAAAITAIVVAVVAFSDEVEEAKQTYDEFAASVNQDLEADLRFSKIVNGLKSINQEILEVRSGTESTEQAIVTRNNIIQQGFEKEIAVTEKATDELSKKKRELEAEREELQKAGVVNDRRTELTEQITQAGKDIEKGLKDIEQLQDAAALAEQRGFLDIEQFKAKIREDNLKKAEAAAKEELALRENLNKKLLDAEKQLRLQSLPKEEREVQQVNDQFDSLAADAKQIKNAEVRSATLKRIEEDREKAVSVVLFEQLKARQKAEDDYLKAVEDANNNLKANAVAIEEARWAGVIATAEARGAERIALARKNGEDVAAVEAEVQAGIDGLALQKDRSLLNARLALIDLEGEERKNKAVESAEAQFAAADAAGVSTVELQKALGDQLVQIDQETAQKRIGILAITDKAAADAAQAQLDRIKAAAAEEDAILQSRLGQAADFFGSVSQLAQEQSTEQKALQTTQALINTYAGVAAVFGNPITIGPPPVDLAFRLLSAATVVANGIAAVRRIQGAFEGEEFIGKEGRPDRPGRDGYLRWTHYGERVVRADDNREHFGLLSAMHRGKLDEFIDANYVMPAINKYLSSDEGQRVTHSVMMAPYYDGNIVKALDRGRKTQDKTNDILLAMLKQQPRIVSPNRRMWN